MQFKCILLGAGQPVFKKNNSFLYQDDNYNKDNGIDDNRLVTKKSNQR